MTGESDMNVRRVCVESLSVMIDFACVEDHKWYQRTSHSLDSASIRFDVKMSRQSPLYVALQQTRFVTSHTRRLCLGRLFLHTLKFDCSSDLM